MTIKELREQGCKVRCKHVRSLTQGVFNPEINAIDTFLTRGEYEFLTEQQPEAPSFGDVVESKGGFTEIEVLFPNGEVRKGKHNFGHKRFERKIGVRSALGKILK